MNLRLDGGGTQAPHCHMHAPHCALAATMYRQPQDRQLTRSIVLAQASLSAGQRAREHCRDRGCMQHDMHHNEEAGWQGAVPASAGDESAAMNEVALAAAATA